MDEQIASEKERYKQKLESVGLTLSDDPFMKDNDHRFSDDTGTYDVVAAYRVWPYLWLFHQSPANLYSRAAVILEAT